MTSRVESPLTFGQLSVWRIMEGYPAEHWPGTYLRAACAVRAGTTLDQARGAIGQVRNRHESLRTRFVAGPRGPRQVVMARDEVTAIELVELPEPTEEAVARTADDLTHPRIDRASEFGMRWAVVTTRGVPRQIVFVVDHMVADGPSVARLRAELAASLGDGGPAGAQWLFEHPPQPRDLAAEQRSPAGARRARAAADYWRRLLDGVPAGLFPVDAAATRTPGRIEGILHSARARACLAVLSARTGISPQNLLLALSAIATAAVTCSAHVVLTLQSSNRFTPRWRSLVSSMNQYTPLALVIAPAQSFADFAEGVRMSSLKAYRAGSYDIDTITELVRSERGTDLEFDYFFNFMAHDVVPSTAPAPAALAPGRVQRTHPHRQFGPCLDIKVRAGEEMPIVVRTAPSLVAEAALENLLTWFDEQLRRFASGVDATAGQALARCREALSTGGARNATA